MFYTIMVLILLCVVAYLAYTIGKKYSVTIQVSPVRFELPSVELEGLDNSDDSHLFDYAIHELPIGIISVSEELKVVGVHSKKAENILGVKLFGADFVEVVFGDFPVLKNSFETIHEAIELLENRHEKNTMALKLPNFVRYDDKALDLHYIFKENSKAFYVYIIDVTPFFNAVEESDVRVNELDMVTNVLKHQKDYIELKQLYTIFVTEDLEHIFNFSNDLQSVRSKLRHNLHMFKLRAVALKLKNSTQVIEYIEDVIEKTASDFTMVQFQDKLVSSGITRIFDKDQSVLSRHINDDFMDINYIPINHEAIVDLEALANKLPESAEKKKLLERIYTIRFVGINEVISRFNRYAAEVAKKLGKKVNPIHYKGDNVLVDESYFKDVINGFIELVTNSVEHGIEYPAQRFLNDKTEHGNIDLSLEINDDGYIITFQDDGMGIDINAIKNQLYEMKRIPFDDLVLMNDRQVLDTIFLDGVYACSVEEQNAQKGTGLFILKDKIQSIGGSIEVESVQNAYTRFKVFLPKPE